MGVSAEILVQKWSKDQAILPNQWSL